MAVNFADAVNAYANAARSRGGSGARRGRRRRKLRRDAAAAPPAASSTRSRKGEQASPAGRRPARPISPPVTEAVTNAEVAVQTVVAVRDRVISAYQDIMRDADLSREFGTSAMTPSTRSASP